MDDVTAPKTAGSGKGLSRKEMRKKHIENMSAEERAYLRRKSVKDKVWPFFRFVILVGLSFVILYPLIYMVSCAFRERGDMSDPTVMWIPRHYTLDIIRETIDAMDFWETLKNTVLLNVGCSLVQVISCAITGYGFARFKFKGKKLLFGIVILMILVPTQVIALPLYTQFRYFGIKGLFSVNLIDSRLTMYLPAMTANGIRAGLMILIFRQFFKGLPRELEDAAYIDGCGPFMTFVRVMAPNAAPAFLTVFLFSVVWYWNDYYVSNTFFTAPKTVALMLTNLDSQLKIKLFNDPSVQISLREQIVWKEAGCLLSIAPVLLMYVFLQKHFTEGIERSGIVG
ncbi:multiple sugar transport system permease protein [Ruminococcus flavefaciens]|uniref:Multiple sugar transport system permease protein n=1 Tax=Ruminococcus flavefaciens TaxID=1265 RepID=A0A1H6J2B1_RUMFL|nr:carbohydrate ABC transporter permease [Ruminococcus flavefaciens]SEH55713.1 multiple sugar transport system permease protein [Ruminococcus flavefaciens]